jgi:hypothetical protein
LGDLEFWLADVKQSLACFFRHLARFERTNSSKSPVDQVGALLVADEVGNTVWRNPRYGEIGSAYSLFYFKKGAFFSYP